MYAAREADTSSVAALRPVHIAVAVLSLAVYAGSSSALGATGGTHRSARCARAGSFHASHGRTRSHAGICGKRSKPRIQRGGSCPHATLEPTAEIGRAFSRER